MVNCFVIVVGDIILWLPWVKRIVFTFCIIYKRYPRGKQAKQQQNAYKSVNFHASNLIKSLRLY